jgi:hypothetical protein
MEFSYSRYACICTKIEFVFTISVHSTVSELFMVPSPPGLGVSHALSKQTGRFLAPALHKTHGLIQIM